MNSINLTEQAEQTFFSEERIFVHVSDTFAQILKRLQQLFKSENLRYFAFDLLLQQGVFCHDFFADGKVKSFKIGMLRKEYEKAKGLISNETFGNLFVVLKDTYISDDFVHEGNTIKIGEMVSFYQKTSFKTELIHKFAYIEICPFDFIPDNPNEAGSIVKRIRELNDVYKEKVNRTDSKQVDKKETSWYTKVNGIFSPEHINKSLKKELGKLKIATNTIACITSDWVERVSLEQIFPLQECRFRDFSISIPNDSSVWCGEFEEGSTLFSEEEAADKINHDKGEILRTLDKVFVEKGLHYFAYASLLIHTEYYHEFFNSGKVENAKIGMVRDDFEKARVLLQEREFSGFQVCSVLEEISLPLRTIQIGRRIQYYSLDDNDNILFNNSFIGIEINAFDYVPDEYEQARFHFWQMRKRNAIYNRASVYWMNKVKRKHNTSSNIYGKLSDGFLVNIINNGALKFNNQTNTVACVTPQRSKIITLEQLYPLKRSKFRDFEIFVPNDISVWCYLFTPEVEEQTKSIQKVSLEILKKIDKVCQELGIGYFICGGSMLGAVRHGGFIPWDDDIDIGMLRKDYEVFLEKGQKLLGDSVFLQTRETDPEIPYLFSKVRANNTLYITNYNEFRNFHKGICVDIFPFDNIPDNIEEQQKFRKEVRFWEKIHNRVVNKQKPEQYFLGDKKRTLGERLIHLLNEVHRRFYCLIPLWLTQKLYLRKAEKYNSNTELEFVASFVPSYTFIKREDLLPYKRMNFSGFQALVPKRPEVFLKMQYGDFMAMPPEHKRMGHDLIKWSADTTKENGEDKL